VSDPFDELLDELRNFQDIAKTLKPSPGGIPKLSGIDIGGISIPLKELVGGDHVIYIDFNERYNLDRRIRKAEAAGEHEVAAKLQLNRHRAGILLSDVSGHRITDALIAAMLHQAFLLGIYYELDLFGEITTQLFEYINQRFYRTTSVRKYLTMLYGEISDEGRFRFISAGHPRPMIYSREFGRFVDISERRMVSYPPVGMFPSASAAADDQVGPGSLGYKELYTINEIDLLAEGDLLLLYTDGLSEHADGRCFPTAIEGWLRQLAGQSASEICRVLSREILAQAPAEDDISFVVVKKTAV
jgi:serine phosphatase RsbU (regulator of sigma subunit)